MWDMFEETCGGFPFVCTMHQEPTPCETCGCSWTVALNIKINVGDVWRDVDEIKINVGDVWRTVKEIWINIGDTWRQVF